MDTNIAAGPQRLCNGGMAMKKIACLFPGIGYTCDKPLLYYSWKLLKGLDWEIVPVLYSGFPSGVKGNAEKMQQCAHMALEQAEDLLQEIDWSEYTEILLIGKSIGTVVCAAYAKRHLLMRDGHLIKDDAAGGGA